MPPMSTNEILLRKQQQQQQLQQERINQQLKMHLMKYPLNLSFPASIVSGSSNGEGEGSKKVRTNFELIQHRLLESGILFDDSQTLGEVSMALAPFVKDLDETGCFESVRVEIGKGSGEGQATNEKPITPNAKVPKQASLTVALTEKKWYSLYIGGGIKHESSDGSGLQTLDMSLPKVQFQSSASLLNVRGYTDKTSASYSVDPSNTATVSLSHDAPFHSLFPEASLLRNTILMSNGGSKTHATISATKDTVDFESSRSYKEFQRLLSIKVSNVGTNNMAAPEQADSEYKAFEWMALYRDLLPRRHPTSPYACDASPNIVSQAGPSFKHSVAYEYRMNNTNCNDRFNPTQGFDVSCKAELAGPPGDTGFIKCQTAASCHIPLPDTTILGGGLAFHGYISTGIMKALTYGGLCSNVTNISDRFFIGGPLQLRGFEPAGIGPRANSGGASVPGGDTLGGEMYYATTLAASMPFPFHAKLRDTGVRVMAFCNAGNLLAGLVGNDRTGNMPSLDSVLKSSRVAVGGGLTYGTAMGKMELTYSLPLRFGPRDVRKNAQFGFGFRFGC